MTNDKIEDILYEMGLDPKWRGRYWNIHCPLHEDKNKSAVMFPDGWLCCFAGCPRTHINKLAGKHIIDYTHQEEEQEADPSDADFTEFWMSLPLLPDGAIKGVPSRVLNKLGWRWWDGGFGYPPGVFIPYFNMDRNKVKYFQIRHTDPTTGESTADRRFSFARGVSPICYGYECIPQCERYLVFTEGSRDSVILRMAGVPCVAIPSASSGAILKRLCRYAREHQLMVVAAGDNDDAGDKLLGNLEGPYIDARPVGYKDIGEMYEDKGLAKVKEQYAIYKKQDN